MVEYLKKSLVHNYFMPSFVSLAPHSPGVYLMKDALATVIYVGKAKDLKNRISSYFNNKKHDSKTMQLVEQIADIEFIITSNETEALILESNLIKKFKGKYNVDLKDSYRYPYVKVTNEPFSKIVVVREPKKNLDPKDLVFGPFVDGSARHTMIDMVEKTFRIRTCKTLPKKACLKFYMGQCTAPCIQNVSREEYAVQVEKAADFFSGKRETLISILEEEMKLLAKSQNFELALQKREAIETLKGKMEKQVVDTFKNKNQDFIAFKKTEDGVRLLVLPFRRGTLLGKKLFSFDSKLVSTDIVEDFLLEYYSQNVPPHEIVLSEPIARADEIMIVLSDSAGYPVAVRWNPSADAKRMLDIAKKNLEYALNPTADPLVELKTRLFLPKTPKRIECFDISHMGGSETVASMVVFENGKPNKANYRKFRILTAQPGDDYAAMFEVLDRRYGGSLSKDLPLPDLVVVDGGKGQLSTALMVFRKMNLSLPVIGLAKRNEEIFVPIRSTAIALDRSSPGLRVLTNLRDEAHRFANVYRKNRMKKRIPK